VIEPQFKSIKAQLKRIREFDYANLSFLYIACLLTIALTFTLFRASQQYLEAREAQALSAIELIGHQRELISEFERLIAFSQNRTSPQYPITTKLLVEVYGRIMENHAKLAPRLELLRKDCENRLCAMAFRDEFFTFSGVNVALQLADNKMSLTQHNLLLQNLFDLAVNYRMVLKDAFSLAFEQIHKKNRNAVRFDMIAYLSLMILLLIQAIYIFRPAIRRLSASLSTRSDFLSRISHEIRNPMNSIIGMADILKGTKLSYEQQQYVNNLIRSGHALLDMLNNLIDSSAIEGGKLSLKSAPFDLFRTIERCMHLVSLQAHHKNLNMYFQIAPEVPCRLIGDSVRLEQVLINLLSNAVKFTEQGHVTLKIDCEADTEEQTALRFAVEDTGIGIKSDQVGGIFESFVQGDSSIKRKYGGSGLGLSIASEIIRMMGGELRVTSEFGQGSAFFFTVTLNKQYTFDRLSSQPLAAIRDSSFVFVVSHAEENAYRAQFNKLGASATLLHSSHEMRNYMGGDPTRATQILIDDSVGIISMITCRNLAEEKGVGDRTVALIRSNFTKENMDLLRKNGFTRFLTKPLKPWELLTLPQELHEDSHRSPGASTDLIGKLKEKNLRVLLVDDSNDNLFLMKEVIGPLASTIHFAENGLEATEKFAANVYDTVLMDIQMPVMDGYTAIRKMREIEQRTRRSIPIFAVTAHAGLVDAQKCREAGFTDRIVKPVVRGDIYKSLSKAFSLEAPEGESDLDSTIPARYIAKLMPTFFKSRSEDMARLQKALEDFDFETAQQLGHKMKGSSASYGFMRASLLSSQLEIHARDSDPEACRRVTEELKDFFDQQSRRMEL
jgi:signal transduction histidine kinase/CheY-like chemotaxis protein